VQDCLRDHAVSVSWECQEELFRQEVENADDLRLSHRLFKKCMGDKKKFCADVKFGARSACANMSLVQWYYMSNNSYPRVGQSWEAVRT
jgi:Golgi apparatus protein 1